MNKKHELLEKLMKHIFLWSGLITIGFVLLITVYLIIAGLPAIREIGPIDFLLGDKWASTAKEPLYGILPFITTSFYGTMGAIVLGVPCLLYTSTDYRQSGISLPDHIHSAPPVVLPGRPLPAPTSPDILPVF